MGCKVCAEFKLHMGYPRQGDAIARCAATKFHIDMLTSHASQPYHKRALALFQQKHGIEPLQTSISTAHELLQRHFRTVISNAMEKNPPNEVPWLV